MIPPALPTAEQTEKHDALARLSGAEFDRQFAAEMVKGHEEEIAKYAGRRKAATRKSRSSRKSCCQHSRNISQRHNVCNPATLRATIARTIDLALASTCARASSYAGERSAIGRHGALRAVSAVIEPLRLLLEFRDEPFDAAVREHALILGALQC